VVGNVVVLSNDVVFYQLFYQKNAHMEVLKKIIENTTNTPVFSLSHGKLKNTVLNTEQKKVVKDLKLIANQNKENEFIAIIEMQNQYSKVLISRMDYYLADEFGMQLKKGEEYKILKPVKGILILMSSTQDLPKKNILLLSNELKHIEGNKKTIIEHLIKENITLYILQPKFTTENKFLSKFFDVLKQNTEEDLEVIKETFVQGEKDMYNLCDDIIEINKNKEIMYEANRNEIEKKFYNMEKKIEREEGKIEGKIEGKMEMAKEMLLGKIDIKLISKISKLSIEEIEKIKKEL